jgi:hypothetical protein
MFRSVNLRAHARIYPMLRPTDRRFCWRRVSAGQRRRAESIGIDKERRSARGIAWNMQRFTPRKTYFFIAVCAALCGVASIGLAAFCKRFVSVTPEGLRITILDRPSRPPGRKIILWAGSYAMLYPFTSVGSSWSTTLRFRSMASTEPSPAAA